MSAGMLIPRPTGVVVEHLESDHWNSEVHHFSFVIENPQNMLDGRGLKSNPLFLKGTNRKFIIQINRGADKENTDSFGFCVHAVCNMHLRKIAERDFRLMNSF